MGSIIPDTQKIGKGVIVGVGDWPGQLERNKQAFLAEFVNRPAFKALYDDKSQGEYLSALYTNTGVTPKNEDYNTQLIALLASAETRATTLRKIAESDAVTQQEFNRAFVLMQYFGYLRRNPDDPPDGNLDGYNFWLNKLNSFNGDYIRSEMVRSFIVSQEYRKRFGAP